MVEGARLESVYRGNSIEGSNPSLSATLFTAESASYALLISHVRLACDIRGMLTLYRRHLTTGFGDSKKEPCPYEVLMTPATYAAVGFLKRKEHVDTFDYQTDFSPFHVLQ